MSVCVLLSFMKHPAVAIAAYRLARKEDFVSGRVLLVFRIDGYGTPIDPEIGLESQANYPIEVIGTDGRGFVQYRYLDRKPSTEGLPSVPVRNLLDSRTSAYVVRSREGAAASAVALPLRS